MVGVKEASNRKHGAKMQQKQLLTNRLNYRFPLQANNRGTLSDSVQVTATSQSARSKQRHVGPPSLASDVGNLPRTPADPEGRS